MYNPYKQETRWANGSRSMAALQDLLGEDSPPLVGGEESPF
jgi:hypothetical protein